MTIDVKSLGSAVRVAAENDGLWFRFSNPDRAAPVAVWPAAALDADAGRATAIELDQLQEQGLAEITEYGARIPFECFAQARRLEYRSTTRWTEWSPFMLSISPNGDLGRPDFKYRYRYRLGATEVALRRVGYFVQRSGQAEVFHLDEQTFALVEAMDRYNALPVAERTNRENWVTFALVKDCAANTGAAIDRLLQANEVVVPSRVGVRIVNNADDSVSFVPRCDRVAEEGLAKAFLARPNAEGVYSVDLPGGGRTRVVLDDDQREVLARLKRLQGLRGRAKDDAVKNPGKFFDGLLDRIDLPYGRRVEGVGEFPFATVPRFAGIRTGIFDGVERAVGVEGIDEATPVEAGGDAVERPAVIECARADGKGALRIELPTTADREQFRQKVHEALGLGSSSLQHNGAHLAIDAELAERLSVPPSERQGKRPGKYLLIYTDEDDLRAWDEEVIRRVCVPTSHAGPAQVPGALREGVALKAHQREGLQWLQHCAQLQPDRRGCLLADDMGLGKTLQVLTYLAWAIEQGKIKAPGAEMERGPWRPILIIAPLILVEAGTWRKEMERFFRNDGSIFEPVKVLHGRSVAEFRKDNSGRETDFGAPTLAAEKLMRYRVIITNYETVKNYQHSFAQAVGGASLWSIVITDEAQEYKVPSTKISHAVKALQPDFHVASTGTPVENRLLDVWNIADAIQPALLGTAREFTSQHERPPQANGSEAVSSLRDRLLFGAPNAFVVRRDKTMLTELPPKRIRVLPCEMTDEEVRLHKSLIAGLCGVARGANHLNVLHRLSALYQHPSLLDDSWVRKDSRTLLAESAKLRGVIKQLHEIRGRSEKALVFARLTDMQQLLAAVLQEEFGLCVRIVNGTTPRDRNNTGTTARARETRSKMLEEFRTKPGFHVIILSPFVAGIGLTLTEANHVIHYGRWWNPAVEAQATDRAYRIGQEKPVTVHLPILSDPSRRIEMSFDECLHRMLQQKESLARDFLQPMPGEDKLAEELRNTLVGGRQDQAEPVDPNSVGQLSPSDFEALVGCLFRHKGYQVVLTSRSSDGGADVVAVKDQEVVLVQAKHTSKFHTVSAEAVGDILGAQSIYQSRMQRRFRLQAVSNGFFDSGCTAKARQHGVTLIDGKVLRQMIEDAKVSLGEIAAMNGERATSFADGVRRINGL